jgi:membrane fusion protein, heavy metal efflux system
MKTGRMTRIIGILIVVSCVGVAAFLTRERWIGRLRSNAAQTQAAEAAPPPAVQEPKVLKISPQARKNLGLVSKPVTLRRYWKTIQIPGVIVDRPGRSDRGVTAPAVGVVAQVHAFPGDTVRPGERLFTLRVFSEYLQNTQSELFKAAREIQLLNEQRARLEGPAKSGAIAEAKLIEVDNQLRRQTALIQAYRQDLLTRGISTVHIDGITEGRFVSTIEVTAPPPQVDHAPAETAPPAPDAPIENRDEEPVYEVQELRVELGQQVQAGELLSMLSNHRALYVEGHAFKRDAPALERAAQRNWPLEIEFAEDDAALWPALNQTFSIRHLANSIDPQTRTLDFFVPLTNQSRGYERDGETFVVWRFRPGQRVRLHVPVEELQKVIVLPREAVVREGPEAYVFQQNGDLFNRRPVQILHEDRRHVVLANDGSVAPGLYVAQNAAASLNRVLKAQAASGIRADVHVHADGTVHAAH